MTFVLLIFSISACNNSSENAKDMSEFTEDKEFKDAHELPDSLDFKPKGEMVGFPTTDGEDGSGYILNAENTNQVLLVIHEWWGLNDHIKKEADRLFEEMDGATVIALDMYDGNVADNRDDAGKYMKAVEQERAEAIVKGAN